MTSLAVRFACNNPENRAEEFQHHLVSQELRVQPETRGTEVWLSYPDLQDKVVRKIVEEAHLWCLDRDLSLMRNSEGGAAPTTTLLIADLLRAMS